MSATTHAYPIDTWRIRETDLRGEMLGRNETIFAQGNGYLGMRGTFEEGHWTVVGGTYLNGFYEQAPIIYGETAYGYAKNRQVMLNVADAKGVRLTIGGEELDLRTGKLSGYERFFDLKEGVLIRRFTWTSPGGRRVAIQVRRIVSLARRHVAAIDYRVTLLDDAATASLVSGINGAVTNQAGADDPRIGTHLVGKPLHTVSREADGTVGSIAQQTTSSRMALACVIDHSLSGADAERMQVAATTGDDIVDLTFSGSLRAGNELRFQKLIAYVWRRDLDTHSLLAEARKEAAAARGAGFDTLLDEQRATVAAFWQAADVEIDGDDALQQGIRYNLFSLFQSAGRDERTSIAAKGLTGEGYEGHYFWDTEIYVLPFFTYVSPAIARNLIRYRCSKLDKARDRAREMSQKGALFPWRTIGGEETSPYYPAGTAQYHINADIVFAFKKYADAHGDRALMIEYGAEMVFETARLWADLGKFLPRRSGAQLPFRPGGRDAATGGTPPDPSTEARFEGRAGDAFYINEVTGPDEYTALVNNNLYTNLMAQLNLRTAGEIADRLQAEAPRELARIRKSIGLTDREIEEWRRAADSMFLPYDFDRGIHAQDDAFLQRAVWDFSGTPKDRYPLLLHFHPLVIYRHQVLKQPDVVLAQILRGDCFTMADKKRNYDYYDKITTGDSSLSPCIQSVAASELGYAEEAYRYFMRTARMDLDDVNGNVVDGVHTAAMAGTWISLIYGFAGMRDYGGRLSFDPHVPQKWKELRFRLACGGGTLDVRMSRTRVSYTFTPDHTETPAFTVLHRGREIRLEHRVEHEESLVPRIECVVFDLDGVITDTAEFHYQAWARLAGELDIPFDRSFNERLKGVSRMDSLALILERGKVTKTPAELQALADRKNGYYKELIRTITPGHVLPGMLELLKRLRAAGILTAIASVSHNVWEVVRRLEIGGLVDRIVDPRAIIRGKPDPEIFMSAAESLRVPFEHCVGIEDAQAGIDAIRAARMYAVGVGRGLKGMDWLAPDTSAVTFDELQRRFSSDRSN